MKSKLIVIDGLDGSGKTTQFDIIKNILAEKHNVKATFFVVGNYLETRPDLVKQMVEEGHILTERSQQTLQK